ncbi:septum site-determining protein MinC [Acidithiobacillus sulfuriphilus]|uniref:Septum site-determining protein MinC n=2 Tax=Acidithiobacillus sulfuriphilus TaxID=1867749 RepID=A0ACD5HNW9_9PROT|nr:septum site-determining protein MinC [Acidithiobacillus sulfuriphilus]RNF64779.1 septum site-determining protein MinC [Acidithiobacillus sulfuriphilus]
MPGTAAAAQEARPGALRLSGGVFTLSVLTLESPDAQQLATRLQEERQRNPAAAALLKNAPVVLDLSAIPGEASLALGEILAVLRGAQLLPVGVRNAAPGQQQLAGKHHLPILRGQERPAEPVAAPASAVQQRGALLIDQPVRSGQRVYARGGDLICLGVVNAGAEVLADGHIHVYAPLRGRALAGVSGDETARIFCSSLEAELVSIAGLYRMPEPHLEQWGQASQVFTTNEQLHIAPLGGRNT